MPEPIYSLADAGFTYPDAENPALRDLSLQIGEGEFVLVFGPSGSGKSTLARLLGGFLPEYSGGELRGQFQIRGRPFSDWEKRELRQFAGMVFQNPERQLVTNTVENEIVFGLENLATPRDEMKLRLAEISPLFQCTPLLERNPHELSGGEQQRVAIAAALAMASEVLILDEPASQLDPVAAEALFTNLHKLQQEFGLTVILIEQRLDICFRLASRVIRMEQGEVIWNSPPRKYAENSGEDTPHSPFLPDVPRLFSGTSHRPLPLSVAEGRSALASLEIPPALPGKTPAAPDNGHPPYLQVEKLHFRYPDGKAALAGVHFGAAQGELLCVLGENGAGKSTLLKTILQVCRPHRGRVTIGGRDLNDLSRQERTALLGYLSQNPDDYLFNDTVKEEVEFTLRQHGREYDEDADALLEKLGLAELRQRNPRDLSAGERQRVALASVLIAEPSVLLIDEPTRGLDPLLKARLGGLLRDLACEGKTVLLVTQDIDFGATYADRVAILFRGELVALGTPREVLSRGLFFSTAMNRLFRNRCEGVLTYEDAKSLL